MEKWHLFSLPLCPAFDSIFSMVSWESKYHLLRLSFKQWNFVPISTPRSKFPARDRSDFVGPISHFCRLSGFPSFCRLLCCVSSAPPLPIHCPAISSPQRRLHTLRLRASFSFGLDSLFHLLGSFVSTSLGVGIRGCGVILYRIHVLAAFGDLARNLVSRNCGSFTYYLFICG